MKITSLDHYQSSHLMLRSNTVAHVGLRALPPSPQPTQQQVRNDKRLCEATYSLANAGDERSDDEIHYIQSWKSEHGDSLLYVRGAL